MYPQYYYTLHDIGYTDEDYTAQAKNPCLLDRDMRGGCNKGEVTAEKKN